ncbi:carbamoyltransferase C-terminal domain-containing protein [Kutzneria viridogrisea]|uniref:Carbamoyltransferase n=1 Tax=Kutzneria viridogrisea TaxID=47990 RepID=A0ABR6BAZ5_9PSEU|nr:carbamoyltransferase [Kutzneria viridogrisea]
MIVLGYNGFSRVTELLGKIVGHGTEGIDRHQFLGHDAGAAVFVDGVLVAAVEEERLNRRRKTTAFPINAITWCLREAGLTYTEVDRFAFSWCFTNDFADRAISGIASAYLPAEQKIKAIADFGDLYTGALSRTALIEDFARNTGFTPPSGKYVVVPHHRAHLACGRALAGFGDTAFYVSDGQAEEHSAIAGEIRGGRVRVLDQFTVGGAHSIGLLFAEITRYLGFVPNNDEYKVMGLAGFGTPPEHNPLLDKVVALAQGGRYSLAPANGDRPGRYEALLDATFDGDRVSRGDFDFQVRVAAAAQDMIERVTAHQLTALSEVTGLRSLIFEGGLALNCVNNTKLLEDLPFDRVEVSFGASDPGVSIGAAAHVADASIADVSPYLGPEYEAEAIRAALDEHATAVTWRELPFDQLVAETAALLTDKNVIGWFQGRAEYGPRALGNRSILANPSFPDMKDVINNRVKHREPFRPFAPVVLEEDAPRVFDLGKKTRSPYMTFVFPVRPEFRDKIVAATHVDGTSRIQTITDEGNPRLAALLRDFTARTSVPCLVNTSFNVAGEPIVCSPADAVACFLGTDIDHLVIGDFLVSKR